jgi:segregation and condensation protein B
MEEQQMMAIAEAILFIAGDPVPVKSIAEVLDIDVDTAERLMEKMTEVYISQQRGLQLIRINDAYQLVTRPEYGEYIRRFTGAAKEQSLSRACLETLAIIAYNQPVTKADIEQLRGVKCDHAIAVLLEKNLIREVGRLDAPGKPKLYGTTELFLKSFGLSSIDDLPPLKPQQAT